MINKKLFTYFYCSSFQDCSTDIINKQATKDFFECPKCFNIQGVKVGKNNFQF